MLEFRKFIFVSRSIIIALILGFASLSSAVFGARLNNNASELVQMEKANQTIATIFAFLEAAKEQDYIGEGVSQLTHALQAAKLAKDSGGDSALIIAALLHDIGHLCASSDAEQMGGYGVHEHHKVGANFLRRLGFGEDVADLVESHVDAKRYKVAVNVQYRNKLSEASRMTLEYQGGPMSAEEIVKFESHPLFEARIQIRTFDELAKFEDLAVPELHAYYTLIWDYLVSQKIQTDFTERSEL